MAEITKHDGKQERERDNRKDCRIHLSVARDAVRVYDALENRGNLVRPKVSRRHVSGFNLLENSADRCERGLAGICQRVANLCHRVVWNPKLRDENLARHVFRAHVHRVINRLLAKNELEPVLQIVCNLLQNRVAMLNGRVERRLQLHHARSALGVHLTLSRVIIRKRISVHVEGFANFDNLLSRALTGEENYDDCLFTLFPRGWICERSENLRLLEKHVTARRAEQDALKRDHFTRHDDPCDETQANGGVSTTTRRRRRRVGRASVRPARVHLSHFQIRSRSRSRSLQPAINRRRHRQKRFFASTLDVIVRSHVPKLGSIHASSPARVTLLENPPSLFQHQLQLQELAVRPRQPIVILQSLS